MGPFMPYLLMYPFEICHGQFLEEATVSWTRVGPGGNLFLLLAAVRHEVSDPRVVVCPVTDHGVVAKGVGVLATGHVLPARRTPTHPLRWLGFGCRCPVAILVQVRFSVV